MEVKRIKCKNCGSILQVTNSTNERVKTIICPVCKKEMDVLFPDEEGKTIMGEMPDDGRTVLPSKQDKVSTCALFIDGVEHGLFVGKNTIGRKAASSLASLQIDTSDMYMSRHHAVIIVKRISDESLRVTVMNYENKNKTIVDGMTLDKGDEIVLHDGSIIKMGHTEVILKYK